MAKQNALNIRFYVQGYDLSGDANSISGLGINQNLLDVSTIDTSAHKRITGLQSGTLGLNVWFDAATGQEHDVFIANSGTIPSVDQNVLVPMGSAVGDPSVHMVAKVANYNVDTGDGSAPVSGTASFESNGYAPQFGVMLTAHQDTHASTTSGTAVDNGSSSANGGSAVLQAFSLGSGSTIIKIQHSTNNSAWTDLITFNSVTGVASQHAVVTGTVNQYLRVRSTGTFTDLVLSVDFARG